MDRPELEAHFLSYRASGDPLSLARVFDLAAPQLYELARRLARDRASAEDLLQDTFVTAIEKREIWDEQQPLLPWLVGILALHSQRKRRESARVPDPTRLAHAETERPDEALAEGERRELLMAAIAALRPEERSLVEQRLLEGWSPAEMARELDVPATTLRMRLSRALARLRRQTRGLSWGIVPGWSRRAAVNAVRAKLLPGAPVTGASLLPTAAALGGLVLVAGAIVIAACLEPKKPEQPRVVARGEITLPLPPVVTIGAPPGAGEIAAPAADAPRKRLHIVVHKEGKPLAGAQLTRLFTAGGYEGYWPYSDALGRIEVDLMTAQALVQLCVGAPACTRELIAVDPAQLREGESRTIDLAPGPEAVKVRFISGCSYPKGFKVFFIPIVLFGDRRPDPEGIKNEFLSTLSHPESRGTSLRLDGTTEDAIVPGNYWVWANPDNVPSGEWLEFPSCCFEVDVPEGRDCDVPYLGAHSGALVLDVLGPATIGMDVYVTIDDGDGKPRQLWFRTSTNPGGTTSSNGINVGTLGCRSEPIPPGEHTLVFEQRGKEIDRRKVTIVRGEELKLSISP